MKSVMENINYLGLGFIRNGKLHDAIRVFRNGLKIYPGANSVFSFVRTKAISFFFHA